MVVIKDRELYFSMSTQYYIIGDGIGLLWQLQRRFKPDFNYWSIGDAESKLRTFKPGKLSIKQFSQELIKMHKRSFSNNTIRDILPIKDPSRSRGQGAVAALGASVQGDISGALVKGPPTQ